MKGLIFVLIIFLSQVGGSGKDLSSVCVCECCRWTGLAKMQCANSALTSVEVDSCSTCGVSMCAKQFDLDCPERGSRVKSYCVNRSSWKLKFVPMGFLCVTFGLLIYGYFFMKKEDA